MSIQLSHVSKRYGRQEVLCDISFQLQPGDVVGFLGRNGAGKSTCMKIITGGVCPDSGQVEVCGHSLVDEPMEARRCMGYLPENNPLYGEMTPRVYLQYVAGVYRIDKAETRVETLLEQFHLQVEADKPIACLSKGNKQRVGLAQALIHDPKVLVLDEPFSGLDPMQLGEMHELVRTIQVDKAILFSSHSLSEVADLCSRLLILHDGVLKVDAPIADLTQQDTLEHIFKEMTR